MGWVAQARLGAPPCVRARRPRASATAAQGCPCARSRQARLPPARAESPQPVQKLLSASDTPAPQARQTRLPSGARVGFVGGPSAILELQSGAGGARWVCARRVSIAVAAGGIPAATLWWSIRHHWACVQARSPALRASGLKAAANATLAVVARVSAACARLRAAAPAALLGSRSHWTYARSAATDSRSARRSSSMTAGEAVNAAGKSSMAAVRDEAASATAAAAADADSEPAAFPAEHGQHCLEPSSCALGSPLPAPFHRPSALPAWYSGQAYWAATRAWPRAAPTTRPGRMHRNSSRQGN